jgi:signal peptidase I
MPLAATLTRVARRTLDILLILLIAFVLAMLALSRGLPLLTGGSTFVVGGPSMTPAIPVGAVVHAVPVEPGDLRVGDIVSLKAGPTQAVFTHRITRLVELPDGAYLETKGDANEQPDPALIPVRDTIGRVELTVPVVGFGVVLLSTLQGVLFLLSLAGMLLVGAWLLETLEDDLREGRRRRDEEGTSIGPDITPEAGAAV